MRWYVSRNGKSKGPYDKADIIAAVSAGQIGLNDTLCQEGTEEWLPVRQLGAFAAAVPAAPAASTEPAPAAEVQRVESLPTNAIPEPPSSFLETMFDLSFERFLMVRIVRWLYAAALFSAALLFLAMVSVGIMGAEAAQQDMNTLVDKDADLVLLATASTRRAVAIATAVSAPFAAAFIAVGARVLAEMTVVVFSIAETLKSKR